MPLDQLHHGRPGLWANCVILSVASALVGVCFIIDGKGVTSSPAYDPARAVMRGLQVPAAQAMRAWGAVFIAVGVIATWPLLRATTSLLKGQLITPLALLWVFWATMFAVYAIENDGLGAVGAVIWAAVAACLFVGAATYFAHARRGNGAPRG